MWQRFSEAAREAVFAGEKAAKDADSLVVSTEHLLKGLCQNPDSHAIQVLTSLGISSSAIERELARRKMVYAVPRRKRMALNVDAKKAIDLTYENALRLKQRYIDTEHLLLGLAQQGGVASQALAATSADYGKLFEAISKLQVAPTD